jgi:GTP cyclohydrolase IB
MARERRFLVDVGIKDLPFPMRVVSRVDSEGQPTIANISVSARIMREFEARWIDKFIQIIHRHKDRIGTKTLSENIIDYLRDLEATAVKIDFTYPYFVEKSTPVSKEKCLVRYMCTYAARAFSMNERAKIRFTMEIPVITTYPGSDPHKPGGLLGQLSVVELEVESRKDIYPEDLVELVDRHALMSIYSFLTEEDQIYVIQKVHTEEKSSVVVTDEIKNELSKNHDIDWYSVRSSNYGMLHSYSTIIGTEKGMWVPSSGFEDEEM